MQLHNHIKHTAINSINVLLQGQYINIIDRAKTAKMYYAEYPFGEKKWRKFWSIHEGGVKHQCPDTRGVALDKKNLCCKITFIIVIFTNYYSNFIAVII